jgi:hypothetical protein
LIRGHILHKTKIQSLISQFEVNCKAQRETRKHSGGAQAICIDQVWEVRKTIGKEIVNDILYYWVRWAETLEPEHTLGDAKEMVDKFEARLCKREVKKQKKRPGSNRGKHMVVEANASAGQQQKRRRGRSLKQLR